MKAQKAQNDPQKVLEEMEKERKEMEEMFTIKAGEADKLREKDVLSNHTRICQKFTLAIGTLGPIKVGIKIALCLNNCAQANVAILVIKCIEMTTLIFCHLMKITLQFSF